MVICGFWGKWQEQQIFTALFAIQNQSLKDLNAYTVNLLAIIVHARIPYADTAL